jgi:hypothetical protein
MAVLTGRRRRQSMVALHLAYGELEVAAERHATARDMASGQAALLTVVIDSGVRQSLAELDAMMVRRR